MNNSLWKVFNQYWKKQYIGMSITPKPNADQLLKYLHEKVDLHVKVETTTVWLVRLSGWGLDRKYISFGDGIKLRQAIVKAMKDYDMPEGEIIK